METKIDICPKCDDVIQWGFDPMQDAGRCPTCGEVYYPIEE